MLDALELNDVDIRFDYFYISPYKSLRMEYIKVCEIRIP